MFTTKYKIIQSDFELKNYFTFSDALKPSLKSFIEIGRSSF